MTEMFYLKIGCDKLNKPVEGVAEILEKVLVALYEGKLAPGKLWCKDLRDNQGQRVGNAWFSKVGEGPSES